MAEHYGGSESSMNSSATFRWQKGEIIGCGAHARVYKGVNLDSGELIAVKEVLIAANSGSREQAQVHIREVEKEVNLLRNLSHRNIVQYLGTARENDFLNILLEFVPGGSLFSLLGGFGFTEPVIRKYTKQLLQGLEYLHKNDIMHRDIKGENILVDKEGCIKLADFGASKQLRELEKVTGAKSLRGTSFWMAPEVIRQTRHHLSSDIWSVGCTVIEMATGKPPWDQQFEEVETTLYHIATTESHPPIPDHLSSEAKDFLQKCLKIEPDLRPNASELLQHPFVVGVHIYDVFLSFRGPDVRDTLAKELFESLQSEGLHVFLDSERIEKGENIGMSLEEAIKDSRLFIPIFSRRYASSAWCLRELSLMWGCKARRAKTKIIPVFYDMQPWQVRYPESERSPFAKAFKRHRLAGHHSREEIDEWKMALYEVSSLSGWQLPGHTIPVIVKGITALFVIKHLQLSATQVASSIATVTSPATLHEDVHQYPSSPNEVLMASPVQAEQPTPERVSETRNHRNNEKDDELGHNLESSSDSSHPVRPSALRSPTRVSESYGGMEIQEYVNHQSAAPLHEVSELSYPSQAEQPTSERVSETRNAGIWVSETLKPKKTWLIGLGTNLMSKMAALKDSRSAAKYFDKNGGFLLQQYISSRGGRATLKLLSAKELRKASENYATNMKLGSDHNGTLFKAIFPDGTFGIIIKSQHTAYPQHQVDMFVNELIILSQINHRNVVKVLGCCLETQIPSLVYEFVSNGALREHLDSTEYLSWENRLRIAIETAEALAYLLSAASLPFCHRDVKSSKILLDNSYTPKVTGFEMSVLFNDGDEANVCGTLAYLDPQYVVSCQLSDQIDVYSFGVVLLELLTGLRPYSSERDEILLSSLFLSRWNSNRSHEILDVRIMNAENRIQMMNMASLARECLHVEGRRRPSMKEVVMELILIKGTTRLRKSYPSDEGQQGNDGNEMQMQIGTGDVAERGETADRRFH